MRVFPRAELPLPIGRGFPKGDLAALRAASLGDEAAVFDSDFGNVTDGCGRYPKFNRPSPLPVGAMSDEFLDKSCP